MKIELHDRTRLTFIPETRDELLKILHIEKIEPDTDAFYEYIARMTQGAEVRIEQEAPDSATEGGGGWARAEGATEWLKPYWELLEHKLGAKPFDIDLIPGLSYGYIRHTYYLEKLWFSAETGKTHYTMVSCIYPRMGKLFPDAGYFQTRAEYEMANDVQSILGTAIPVPEFIEIKSGLFQRNPRYPGNGDTRYKLNVEDDRLLLYMANQWLEKFATPEQREVVDRIHRADRNGKFWCHNYDKGHNQGFHLDACNSFISYEDFKKL